MEQKKKKQVAPGVLRRKDVAPKGAGEIQTITTNRFPISLAEEEMYDCAKKSIREIVFDRGLDDLGNERGIGENLQLAQSLIGEMLIKRYDAKRPTIVASIFDIHNIGDIMAGKSLTLSAKVTM